MDTLRNKIIEQSIKLLTSLRVLYPTEIDKVIEDLGNGNSTSFIEFVNKYYQNVACSKEFIDFIDDLTNKDILPLDIKNKYNISSNVIDDNIIVKGTNRPLKIVSLTFNGIKKAFDTKTLPEGVSISKFYANNKEENNANEINTIQLPDKEDENIQMEIPGVPNFNANITPITNESVVTPSINPDSQVIEPIQSEPSINPVNVMENANVQEVNTEVPLASDNFNPSVTPITNESIVAPSINTNSQVIEPIQSEPSINPVNVMENANVQEVNTEVPLASDNFNPSVTPITNESFVEPIVSPTFENNLSNLENNKEKAIEEIQENQVTTEIKPETDYTEINFDNNNNSNNLQVEETNPFSTENGTFIPETTLDNENDNKQVEINNFEESSIENNEEKEVTIETPFKDETPHFETMPFEEVKIEPAINPLANIEQEETKEESKPIIPNITMNPFFENIPFPNSTELEKEEVTPNEKKENIPIITFNPFSNIVPFPNTLEIEDEENNEKEVIEPSKIITPFAEIDPFNHIPTFEKIEKNEDEDTNENRSVLFNIPTPHVELEEKKKVEEKKEGKFFYIKIPKLKDIKIGKKEEPQTMQDDFETINPTIVEETSPINNSELVNFQRPAFETISEIKVDETPSQEEEKKEQDYEKIKQNILEAQLNYLENASKFIQTLEKESPEEIYNALLVLNDIRYIYHCISKLSIDTLNNLLPYVENNLKENHKNAIDIFIEEAIKKTLHSTTNKNIKENNKPLWNHFKEENAA